MEVIMQEKGGKKMGIHEIAERNENKSTGRGE